MKDMSKQREVNRSKTIGCIRPNAAGIDIASQMHYATIPEGGDRVSVRKFGAFTEDLHGMARWLKSCGIDTVAMESTGVYWIQAYLILEEYGFEVFLVNARHLKNVSGRKSDVQDCRWIQQLHSYGLLEKSFQGESLTRELRSYMRQRKNLTRGYTTQVQLMQKAFDRMNIKLYTVLSDITGKSGMAIIKAILNGQRDAQQLAELADKGVKASKEDILRSLEGTWREDNLFELRQAYGLYEVYLEKIRACDLQIESVLKQMLENTGRDPEPIKRGHVSGKNRFCFNATQYLVSITGVRLTDIFGVSELSVAQILSETGTGMSKWPTEKHFTSWLNLAPNTRISGGKNLRNRPVKKKNHAGQTFLLAASTLKAGNNWLGEFYRRIKAGSGAPTAIKATARKLAVIFYRMLRDKKEFSPLPLNEYNNYFKERRVKYFDKQAAKYGFRLVPVDIVS
jgi:transposase